MTTVPNQCQEMLPANPALLDAIGAPIKEHQSTSGAVLRMGRALVRYQCLALESLVTNMILSTIDVPYPSITTGALQLDGVHMPFACREDAGFPQAEAARR